MRSALLLSLAAAVALGAPLSSQARTQGKHARPYTMPAQSTAEPADPYGAKGAQAIGPASAPHTFRDYAALARLPDWNGIWVFNFGDPGPAPVLTADYAARVKAEQDAQARGLDSPRSSNCLPPGMPLIMSQPYNIEFAFTPGRVTVIQEAYMQVRRVFTDGRRHPQDLEPSFNGHSIGHWEGGTLVVDSAGFKPTTMLTPITPHSDKLHIVERLHLKAPDTLIDDMTVDDAKALAQPWRTTLTYTRHREWDQIEFICEENNRNPVDESGKTHFILRDNPDAH